LTLRGASDGEGERIGIVFNGDSDRATYFSLAPEDALELAARLSDAYGLYRRWLAAQDRDPDDRLSDFRQTGLDPESWRLHVLLESGYDLDTAETVANDTTVDLHQAQQLAKDAGPKLASEILT